MTKQKKQIEDELLVMAVQDGRRAAMDCLVRRWQKRLWHYAWRECGSRQGAWDISQEGWLAIIRGIHKLHDPGRFPGWAYRIFRHKSLDWIRKNHRNQAEPLGEVEAQAHETGPNDELSELMSNLKPEWQGILKLYYYEQLTTGDIAETLGLPVGTVKSRLYHARKTLKSILEKQRP